MKGRGVILGSGLVLGALAVSGCAMQASAEPTAGLANPASEYCEEQGYRIEMRDGEGGSYGVCVLPDGSECEEWAFFRGECGPATAEAAPTEVPATPTDESVQMLDPALARDAALDYVFDRYGEVVFPPPGGDWMEEDVADEGLVGASTFKYTAADVAVTVSFPLVNPAEAVYTVAVIKEGTGFLWEGEVSAELEVREVSEPATGTPVVAWYGYVASVPEGGQFDDCLVLSPEEARRAVGIEGVDEEVEAEIVALRGQEEPGKYAHFWGTLVCDVLDYAGCQVRVAKLRLEGPGPFFGPDPVDGWEGTIVSGPAGPRSGGDDYLIVIVDGIPIEYGIDSQDEAVAATIDSLRDSGAVVRVWGELSAGVIDWNGTQILVERLHTLVDAPVTLEGYEGWGTYTSEAFGYTLRYPAESTVLEASQNSGVQISGPLVDNERWPLIEVSYFHSEFYQPPVDVDLQEWVLEHVPSYDAVDTQTQVAGRPAVHLAHEASPQAYAFDEYYFVEGGQLFRVGIIHTGGQEDWELYDKFLSGVSFLDAQ